MFIVLSNKLHSEWPRLHCRDLNCCALDGDNVKYSKTCLNSHSQKDLNLFFKTNYCLMQVNSIAECSKGSILQYFRPSLSYLWWFVIKIFVLLMWVSILVLFKKFTVLQLLFWLKDHNNWNDHLVTDDWSNTHNHYSNLFFAYWLILHFFFVIYWFFVQSFCCFELSLNIPVNNFFYFPGLNRYCLCLA